MISWLLALLASSEVPYELIAHVNWKNLADEGQRYLDCTHSVKFLFRKEFHCTRNNPGPIILTIICNGPPSKLEEISPSSVC